MIQYFYLIGHFSVGTVFNMDKVFLQEKNAIRWGRQQKTKHPNWTIKLYKQAITKTAVIEYVTDLNSFK